MKLTIENAVKVLEGIANHSSLTLNKAEHILVENALVLIKEVTTTDNVGEPELKQEVKKDEEITD